MNYGVKYVLKVMFKMTRTITNSPADLSDFVWCHGGRYVCAGKLPYALTNNTS